MNMLDDSHKNKQIKTGRKNYKPPMIRMFNKKGKSRKRL
jgi:hypothetical protein